MAAPLGNPDWARGRWQVIRSDTDSCLGGDDDVTPVTITRLGDDDVIRSSLSDSLVLLHHESSPPLTDWYLCRSSDHCWRSMDAMLTGSLSGGDRREAGTRSTCLPPPPPLARYLWNCSAPTYKRSVSSRIVASFYNTLWDETVKTAPENWPNRSVQFLMKSSCSSLLKEPIVSPIIIQLMTNSTAVYCLHFVRLLRTYELY